jgi:hypothetical protein
VILESAGGVVGAPCSAYIRAHAGGWARGPTPSRPRGIEATLPWIVHRSCGFARALGIFASLIIGSAAVPAFAQSQASEPTPEQLRLAAEAFDLGRQSYKDGRFAEAAEQFERADGSAPSATALELALRSRDKAGDLDRAGTLAVLALALYPNDEDIAKIAPDVLERARSDLFELAVTCSEPCEIADGSKVVHGSAATKRTLFLAPGTHNLRAGFDEGRTESKSVEATAGASGTVDFSNEAEPKPEPAVAPVPPPPPEKGPDEDTGAKKSHGLPPVVFWAAAGATVVAGGVTIWSGIDTVNNPGADKVKAECAQGDENCALYKQGRSSQTRTNVLLGVTGVLAVGTAVLGAVAIDWHSSAAPASEGGAAKTHVTPLFGWSQGPSIGARGTF